MKQRVVIVGGGITGLATAYALGARADITLLERGARLGGSIVTEERDGFTIDGGPDSWVASKPHATALAKAVGLEHELMPTIEATRRVYVAWNGELHPLPEGLVLAVPTRMRPVLKSRLFSWGGKLRMGLEPFIPRRAGDNDEDESIADFVTRRLGQEVTERLAAPLLGGIFAGDASKLSIRATFPQFVEMEQQHGSLVLAMRAQRRTTRGKPPPSAFLSVRGGVGALIGAVAARLSGVTVRLGVDVRSVARLPDGDARGRYAVEVEGSDALFADHVVLAAPAHAASRALRALDAVLADELAGIPYASTATAFLAFRRAEIAHALDGVGFIVPRPLRRPILAATWVSSKWANRAPADRVLMRVFFGGAWGEEHLAQDDDGLAATGLAELRHFMGIEATPLFTRVFRFHRSNPQPLVGHLARIARIRARLERWPGVHIAGNGIEGTGIPDCIKQANAVAAAIG